MGELDLSGVGGDGGGGSDGAPKRRVSRMPSHLQHEDKAQVRLSDGLKKCANLLKQVRSTFAFLLTSAVAQTSQVLTASQQ